MTIRKNTRRAAAILDSATNVRVYTLANGFTGEDCLGSGVAAAELCRYSFAKLIHSGGDRYTVHVHSNLWYSFTSAGSC